MKYRVDSKPRIAVVGCGGIGGIVAAHLAESGIDVTAITSNPKIANKIQTDGLHLTDEGETRTIHFEAVPQLNRDAADDRGFDAALLAVPPTSLESAATNIAPFLSDRGQIVCFANGLPEERLAKQFGDDRIIGAIVAFGGTMHGPGDVERTSSGGFTIGRLSGNRDGETEFVSRILSNVGPVDVESNLRGARWSKLAINCAISSIGTVGGDRLGSLMWHRFVRRLALETMTEVVEVANAERVELEKVSGTLDLHWISLGSKERQRLASAGLIAKHATLLAVGAKYRNLRSSMLRSIERGRTPYVDYLNGEIVERGTTHGIPTPINYALQSTVHDIANGDEEPGLETLRKLYEESRPLLKRLELAA